MTGGIGDRVMVGAGCERRGCRRGKGDELHYSVLAREMWRTKSAGDGTTQPEIRRPGRSRTFVNRLPGGEIPAFSDPDTKRTQFEAAALPFTGRLYAAARRDRKSTRLNSSHVEISYA